MMCPAPRKNSPRHGAITDGAGCRNRCVGTPTLTPCLADEPNLLFICLLCTKWRWTHTKYSTAPRGLAVLTTRSQPPNFLPSDQAAAKRKSTSNLPLHSNQHITEKESCTSSRPNTRKRQQASRKAHLHACHCSEHTSADACPRWPVERLPGHPFHHAHCWPGCPHCPANAPRNAWSPRKATPQLTACCPMQRCHWTLPSARFFECLEPRIRTLLK